MLIKPKLFENIYSQEDLERDLKFINLYSQKNFNDMSIQELYDFTSMFCDIEFTESDCILLCNKMYKRDYYINYIQSDLYFDNEYERNIKGWKICIDKSVYFNPQKRYPKKKIISMLKKHDIVLVEPDYNNDASLWLDSQMEETMIYDDDTRNHGLDTYIPLMAETDEANYTFINLCFMYLKKELRATFNENKKMIIGMLKTYLTVASAELTEYGKKELPDNFPKIIRTKNKF